MSTKSNPVLHKMKLKLNQDYENKSLVKISYFTNSTNNILWIFDDFKNPILESVDLEWPLSNRG